MATSADSQSQQQICKGRLRSRSFWLSHVACSPLGAEQGEGGGSARSLALTTRFQRLYEFDIPSRPAASRLFFSSSVRTPKKVKNKTFILKKKQ